MHGSLSSLRLLGFTGQVGFLEGDFHDGPLLCFTGVAGMFGQNELFSDISTDIILQGADQDGTAHDLPYFAG